MAEKPAGWNPSRPTPNVCIHCYDRATRVYLWRYSIDYVCRRPECLNIAKRAVGFEGVFATIGEAARRREAIDREKAIKGAQRGKRRMDGGGTGVRSQDHA